MLATIGAITLFGMLVGSLVLLPYADHYGRRVMNIIFLTSTTVAMWIFLMAMTVYGMYYMLLFACFLGGAVSMPLISVMICYATELSSLDMVAICTCLSFFAESLTSVIIGAYFKYFKNALTFYFIVSMLLTGFLIMYTWWARETPHFLFKQRKYEDLLSHLQLMAKWNKYDDSCLPTIEQMKQARDRYV